MSKLFEPIKIGKSQLQHRVVLAPLTRFRATLEAVPTDIMVEYYRQRASKGGLLITEGTFTDRLAGGFPRIPGIYSKEQIEGWKKVTDAVHGKEGVIYLQIVHLGRAGYAKLNPNNEQIVSASAIRAGEKDLFGQDYEVPRALEVSEIKEIVQQFKQAALNAIEAGFDGVEIHNANGYLLDQFLNTSSNQRTDAYGGSAENRGRFTLEVVEAVASAIGPERTGIRFSPEGSFQDMKDENPVETWGYLTESLQKNYSNLAYLHFIEPRSSFLTENVNTEDSLAPFRKLWNGPFITAGGFSTATKHAEEVATKTDGLVAFGRAFIANPDLPEKLKRDLPLNKYDRSTFYTNEATGYTDYPVHSEEAESRL